MKRICLVFNHLQHQDGVGRSAIAIANQLTRLKLAEVTLIPLFIDEKAAHSLLDDGVKVKSVFGFYFNGLSKLLQKFPMAWLHHFVLGRELYDIEVAFQYGLSLRCVAADSWGHHAAKFAWMHTYDDGLTFRKLYEKIGTVCCVSRCNAERLHKELPCIKVDYCYNPIDDLQVRVLGEECINFDRPDGLLFISVGRLSPEKGFGRLLDVMRRLKNDGYRFHLWIVGNGPIENELKRKQIDLGLQEEILFLGRQNNPHKFTAKADVFVCSSFSEGYSTACTEAIMLGVPVVSTSVSGSEEIITEAECGLVTGMDDESLYNGLKQVCVRPSIVDEWKQKILVTRKRFSGEARIQRLVKLFHLSVI